MVDAGSLSMYDHVRPTPSGRDTSLDGSIEPGIYRVVGRPDDTVTLLRVGDGRRVNTGTVRTVDYDQLSGFERADNPDGNRSFGADLSGQLTGIYWMVRTFGSSLRAHPVLSLLCFAILLFGALGEAVVSWSELALDGMVVLGALGLSYVGSGRL